MVGGGRGGGEVSPSASPVTGWSCEPSSRKSSARLAGVLSGDVIRSSASSALRAAVDGLDFGGGIGDLFREPAVVEVAARARVIEQGPPRRHGYRDVRVEVDLRVEQVIAVLFDEPDAQVLRLLHPLAEKGLQH